MCSNVTARLWPLADVAIVRLTGKLGPAQGNIHQMYSIFIGHTFKELFCWVDINWFYSRGQAWRGQFKEVRNKNSILIWTWIVRTAQKVQSCQFRNMAFNMINVPLRFLTLTQDWAKAENGTMTIFLQILHHFARFCVIRANLVGGGRNSWL